MIERINFLYHKSKGEGLTESEKIEQENLRRKYIDIVKGNFRRELRNFKKKE